jgi:hypothetical protein
MREMFSSLRARVLLFLAIPIAVMRGLTVYAIGRPPGQPGIGFAYTVLDEAGVSRTVVATARSPELSRPA